MLDSPLYQLTDNISNIAIGGCTLLLLVFLLMVIPSWLRDKNHFK